MKQLCEADAAPLIQQRDTINTPVTCGDGQNPRRHCEELTRGHHWFLLILNCSFGTWDDDYITAVCDHCSTIGTQKTLVGPIHLLLTCALIFLLFFVLVRPSPLGDSVLWHWENVYETSTSHYLWDCLSLGYFVAILQHEGIMQKILHSLLKGKAVSVVSGELKDGIWWISLFPPRCFLFSFASDNGTSEQHCNHSCYDSHWGWLRFLLLVSLK